MISPQPTVLWVDTKRYLYLKAYGASSAVAMIKAMPKRMSWARLWEVFPEIRP